MARMNCVSRFCADRYAHKLIVFEVLFWPAFDVQARALCRAFGEYADLTALLLLQPSLSEGFKAAEEPEQANVFWHKHISKGKLRSHIFSSAVKDQATLSNILDQVVRYEKEEETMMSSALHPSYMGAAMSCYAGSSYGKGGRGIFGAVDPSSIRPLVYIFHKCTFLHALCYKQMQNVLMQSIEDQVRLNSILQRMKFLLRLADYIDEHKDALPLNNVTPRKD